MNIELLKYLVELSNNQVDVIDHVKFFQRYPVEIYEADLRYLKNLGYITLLNADNKIVNIGVNKKAIDYFK